MKIGKYELQLSRQTSAKELARQASPRTTGDEQGGAGVPYQGYFASESRLGRTRTPTVSQIMRMIDEDGTAAGLYNVITFPVLATDWRLVPDPEDVVKTKDAQGNDIETHPQADFVENCLRNPQHKGGMSTPFSLVLSEIMLGVAQGHRFFEIVYRLDDEGRIVFQKVVGREHGTYTIKTDDTGGFAGVEQTVVKNGQSRTVNIELPYSFLYTFRKERNKLKGLTAFRAAFYHYDKKHRLYYLVNQQGQQAAVNPKVLTPPDEDTTKAQRDENLKAVDMMAVRPSIALPFGWKLDILQPGRSVDLLPAVDHHDVQMARSVLAQMLMLGTGSDSKGGSYALSSNHTDLFMLGERTLMMTVEEHITAFLISKLIDFNFEKPLYPEFKFNDLTDEVSNLLTTAFNALISKGEVPQWVADGISKKVAEQMEIEEPDDADSTDIGSGSGGDSTTPAVENSKKKGGRRLAKSEWWRELTAAEAKVQFAKIKEAAQTAEESLLEDLKPAFQAVSADATSRLKPLLTDKGAKALDGFELAKTGELATILYNHGVDMYATAKTQAADEIKKNAPANKQASKDLIKTHTQAIVDKQVSELQFNLKTIVTDAVRKNLLDKTELSVADILKKIAGMFDDYFDAKEPLTAAALVSTVINIGRDDVFQQYGTSIYGYQYSAILDDVVCPICEDLDGSVATEAEYFGTIWMPPIHFNCRCIWVAIMSDEQDPPEYTGIPNSPGGADAPSLAHAEDFKTLSVDQYLYSQFLSKETEALWQTRLTS